MGVLPMDLEGRHKQKLRFDLSGYVKVL